MGTVWFRVKQNKCLLEWIIILPKISRNNASDIENKNEKKCEGGEDVMRWRRKTNDSKQKIYACFKQADFLLIVQMLIWQILKCCSKYVFVPNLCHIPPPPLFSSWRSLLTFLCLGNFHFHSHTWNIQICLLLPSKAGQMQQLFENKILQFLKVRGGGIWFCLG